jgi:ABC-type antimicrobial peptide transport system permease subunit
MLVGGFALLALVLATLGIYGVTSHSVSQRRREIGIRLALGALPRDAVMRTLLFDTRGTDPLVLGLGTLGLLSLVAPASYLPARRAARVDPATVLRQE